MAEVNVRNQGAVTQLLLPFMEGISFLLSPAAQAHWRFQVALAEPWSRGREPLVLEPAVLCHCVTFGWSTWLNPKTRVILIFPKQMKLELQEEVIA